MIKRFVVFISFVVVCAALAFEGGRRMELTVPNDLPPKSEPTLLFEISDPTREAQAIAFQPEEIAQQPFAEIYSALKTASFEELVQWLKSIEAIPSTPARRGAIASFFKALVQFDAASAVSLVGQMNKENRWTAVYALKDAAPPRAQEKMAELWLTFDRGEISGCSFDFLRDTLSSWSAFDPVSASCFVERNAVKNLSDYYYLAAVARPWAAYDPVEARTWVDKQRQLAFDRARKESGETDFNYWDSLTIAWVEGYFEHNRTEALDYIVNFQKDADVKESIYLVASELFGDSPDEALRFLKRLGKDGQINALRGIATEADRKTYYDADDWKRSPEYVANWMLQFPIETWREAIDQVMTEWRSRDEGELFFWMSNLPAGTRDAVVVQYRPYITTSNAAETFTHVMQVKDVALRNQLLENFAKNGQDAKPAILRMLETSPLSVEDRQRLARLVPDREYAISNYDEDEE